MVLDEGLEHDQGILQNSQAVQTHSHIRVFDVLTQKSHIPCTVGVVAELPGIFERHFEYLNNTSDPILPVFEIPASLFDFLKPDKLTSTARTPSAILLRTCITPLNFTDFDLFGCLVEL